MDELDADAVPLPLGGVIVEVDDRLLQRVRQHEGAEERPVRGVGRIAAQPPGEELGIGRIDGVPVFLDPVDIDLEGVGEGDLGEPAGDPDPHRPGGDFEERVAARRIEPIEQLGEFHVDRLARHGAERFDRLGHAGRIGGRREVFQPRRVPEQRRGLGRVADEIAAERPQHRVDPRLHDGAHGAGFDGREVEPVGQRGERPAAIGIGRGGEVFGDEAQLLVAAARVGERVDEGGEGFHSAMRALAASGGVRGGPDCPSTTAFGGGPPPHRCATGRIGSLKSSPRSGEGDRSPEASGGGAGEAGRGSGGVLTPLTRPPPRGPPSPARGRGVGGAGASAAAPPRARG